MTPTRTPPLETVFKRTRRQMLTSHLIQDWVYLGVSAVPVSEARQRELLASLQTWPATKHRAVDDVAPHIASFVAFTPQVEVVDNDQERQLALALPASALLRSEPELRRLHPTGLAIVNGDRALQIQFGAGVAQIQTRRRPRSPALG